MAELTFTLGFFDQAHLIKEFKALSSMTPGAFATFAARHQHSMDLELFRNGSDVYLEVGLPPGFNLEHPWTLDDCAGIQRPIALVIGRPPTAFQAPAPALPWASDCPSSAARAARWTLAIRS